MTKKKREIDLEIVNMPGPVFYSQLYHTGQEEYNAFILSFNNYLLSTCYMSVPILKWGIQQ